uniref:Uncharacterized protein n=1 Tax=Sphaerodactylus townsendi TaxID=933632 RepID=A0ACB8EUF3_9SAUR
MLRRTETEISVRVMDTMRKQEDPLQRQRSLVEEERLRYLNEEELITQQLKKLGVELLKSERIDSYNLVTKYILLENQNKGESRVGFSDMPLPPSPGSRHSLSPFHWLFAWLSDLEKAVEKIQKDHSHNHRLISPQELEEKSLVLKQLGDTLTELKGE